MNDQDRIEFLTDLISKLVEKDKSMQGKLHALEIALNSSQKVRPSHIMLSLIDERSLPDGITREEVDAMASMLMVISVRSIGRVVGKDTHSAVCGTDGRVTALVKEPAEEILALLNGRPTHPGDDTKNTD